MIQEALQKVVDFNHLSETEAQRSMEYVMEGQATNSQISAFITALRMKGETVEELTGFVRAMRQKATVVHVNRAHVIDTCGTGGDGKHTLNVSTISAFVAAGAGVTVAKHGNRSVSSKVGSADLLSLLGVNINIEPDKIEECISKIGIGFLFAPTLHKAMKHAVGPRKEIGIRTIFNVLGPLSNPAGVKNQLVGVFDEKLTEPLAKVLKELGAERAFVVHGEDGLDEITVTGTTKVCELRDNKIKSYKISPENFGLKRRNIDEIICREKEQNKKMAISILAGEQSAGRDIVILNAGAAIALSDFSLSIEEGIHKAVESIDSGKAMEKVKQLAEFTNDIKNVPANNTVNRWEQPLKSRLFL